MQSYFNQLRHLSDDELTLICESIDAELIQREEASEKFSSSAFRRNISSSRTHSGRAGEPETVSSDYGFEEKQRRRRAA
jgi:hypothetical protein